MLMDRVLAKADFPMIVVKRAHCNKKCDLFIKNR